MMCFSLQQAQARLNWIDLHPILTTPACVKKNRAVYAESRPPG